MLIAYANRHAHAAPCLAVASWCASPSQDDNKGGVWAAPFLLLWRVCESLPLISSVLPRLMSVSRLSTAPEWELVLRTLIHREALGMFRRVAALKPKGGDATQGGTWTLLSEIGQELPLDGPARAWCSALCYAESR